MESKKQSRPAAHAFSTFLLAAQTSTQSGKTTARTVERFWNTIVVFFNPNVNARFTLQTQGTLNPIALASGPSYADDDCICW
jgi:hypothetical protein